MPSSLSAAGDSPVPPRHMLIFDFDGVLADTEPLHFAAWNQAFHERLGLQLADDYRVLVGLTLEEMIQLWLNTAPDPPITLTTTFRQQLLERKTELFFEKAATQLRPMPGSLDLIHQAHDLGWYTAIASRSARLRLLHTLELIRLPAVFDAVLGSEDVVDTISRRKVHSRAAHWFGVDPARAIVIEDSTSGIRDAVDAGIGHVIGLTSALSRAALIEAGAHQVVDRLAEIQIPIAIDPSA